MVQGIDLMRSDGSGTEAEKSTLASDDDFQIEVIDHQWGVCKLGDRNA